MAEGRERHRRGDYSGAIRAFREALSLVPDDPQVLSEMGWSACMAGDLDLAERSTSRAIGLTTDLALSGALYYNLGRIFEARGLLAEAEQFYRFSLDLRWGNKTAIARYKDVRRQTHASAEVGQPLPRAPERALKLAVTPIAPVAIRVAVDLPSTPGTYDVKLERRIAESASPETDQICSVVGAAAPHRSVVCRAEADTVYRYRARLSLSGRPVQDWLPEIMVRTPSVPEKPPGPPADVKAQGISPFAIEIDWRDESDNEYGFVVEKRVSEGKYARIGFANPNQTRFVEHGLVSGTRATYRVRAFNPRGESPASGEAAAETLSLDGWDAVAAALRNRQRPSPGPCLPQAYLEDVRKNLEEIAAKTGTGDEEGGEDQIEVRFNSVDLGNGHVVDAMIGTCGQGGCDCRLYGTYAGCYRELADFGVKVDADRPDIAFPTRSGWPILRSQMRAGLGMMDMRLLMMVNGRYVVVDSFGGCPDGGRYTDPEWLNDLTKSRPPFFDSDCQTR